MPKMTARRFRELVLSNKPLPVNVKVDGDLSLRGCTPLTTLPEGLKVDGFLSLYGCTSLTTLPEGLKVSEFLDLHGCTSLTHLPHGLKVGGPLYLFRCPSLRINEYGLGEVAGEVWVDESFFKDNKDHLISLVNCKWGDNEIEEWYKHYMSN